MSDDDNENDKGCDNGDFDETESFYADSEYATKDTPKQMPKALRNHPPGGRLAPTPDDFQVKHSLKPLWWIATFRFKLCKMLNEWDFSKVVLVAF